MNVSIHSEPRPEAMADVPGVCDVHLTRAIVQYRDRHEIGAGGRIQDIGLGLVMEGRFAAASQVLDLGSGELKDLDLSAELVVLDWVYEPTLDHVRTLLEADGNGGDDAEQDPREGALTRYSFALALRILERAGYGPLTRPTVLRIGFRDICRDLDLHDGTAIRVLLGTARVARMHMDYDMCSLIVGTSQAVSDPELEDVLAEAFPGHDIQSYTPPGPTDSRAYRVRFPVPGTLKEARTNLGLVRFGLGHLLARFEPDRWEAVERLLDTFGERETLARLRLPQEENAAMLVRSGRHAGRSTVH